MDSFLTWNPEDDFLESPGDRPSVGPSQPDIISLREHLVGCEVHNQRFTEEYSNPLHFDLVANPTSCGCVRHNANRHTCAEVDSLNAEIKLLRNRLDDKDRELRHLRSMAISAESTLTPFTPAIEFPSRSRELHHSNDDSCNASKVSDDQTAMSTSSEGPFMCEDCDKTFDSQRLLKYGFR